MLCHAESDEGHRFSDEDVVNHMIFVLMAAHDTSTITMTQMAYHMAKAPPSGRNGRAPSRSNSDPNWATTVSRA